jgi:hypothetical protein
LARFGKRDVLNSLRLGSPIMSDKYQPAPSVAYRVVQSYALMLLEGDPDFYCFNESGRLIWENLSKGRSLAQVAGSLSRRYGLPKARAEADVRSFAESLASRGILERLD